MREVTKEDSRDEIWEGFEERVIAAMVNIVEMEWDGHLLRQMLCACRANELVKLNPDLRL